MSSKRSYSDISKEDIRRHQRQQIIDDIVKKIVAIIFMPILILGYTVALWPLWLIILLMK